VEGVKMAVNQDELAICRRRGHAPFLRGLRGWTQCEWCGMWLREKTIVEEREDDPPESERNSLNKLFRDKDKPSETD
jgi:hypothetical protein